jgi:hypothetical protein
MNARMMIVILIMVALTHGFIVMIMMLVLLTRVILHLAVLMPMLTVMIPVLALMIPAIAIMDAIGLKLTVMISMPVLRTVVMQKLDVLTLL